MLWTLSLGLMIGMQHALEADHVAAVSCIAARERSVRKIVRHGAVWGVGHTVTLMLVAGGAILLGASLPDRFAVALEMLVGVMLVALGIHVLVRLIRERVHFHRHRHSDGTVHLHAHSHDQDITAGAPHLPAHDHDHPQGLPWRTLAIGMTHGLAGSAALLVLTAAGLQSPWMGVLYVLLFGVGSVLGMAVLSALMAVPLAWTARAMTWTHRGLQGLAGGATAALGLWIAVESVGRL
ncbi:MAG: sulfite exporter TauE/SafE family protein [Alphaproteobacteria bacterium]|nr:sulfite exporter TauE/SafE family protein [Alphaproteobacteria bacterium]